MKTHPTHVLIGALYDVHYLFKLGPTISSPGRAVLQATRTELLEDLDRKYATYRKALTDHLDELEKQTP